MTIAIDTNASTCSFTLNGEQRLVDLERLRVRTDPELRASVLEVDGERVAITEPEAEQLVAAGVTDDRSNLIAD